MDVSTINALTFAAIAPLMALAALGDLRRLRIPNWQPLAVLALFVVLGPAALGAEAALWRLAVAGVALVVGFALFAAGLMGGGDGKLLAAVILFVEPARIADAAFTFAAAILVSVALLLAARGIPAARRSGWLGLEPGARFPMGVPIGVATVAHLAAGL